MNHESREPRSFIDALKGASDAAASFAQRALNFAGQGVARFGTAVEATETIARRYRWGISTSWPFHLVMALAEMGERGVPYHEFEGALMDF